MIDQVLLIATILAVLGTGLIAGSIVIAIRGSIFLVLFFATAAFVGLLGIVAPLKWGEPGALYLLIGSLLYLNGPFGVTLMKNLPLNTKLAALKPDSAESARYWNEFRAAWSGALGAAAAFTLALVDGSTSLPARE